MGKWGKAPQEHIDIFYETLPQNKNVEPRKMFGYPCAFVNGNMFIGLHQEDLIIRLPEELREELLAVEGASKFEPMKGRTMKEYVAVPQEFFSKTEELKAWVQKSYLHTSKMPKKIQKKKKQKSSSKK